jgi:hypothetical protein
MTEDWQSTHIKNTCKKTTANYSLIKKIHALITQLASTNYLEKFNKNKQPSKKTDSHLNLFF